ncbi:MAG: Tex family protein [Moraxella sp.]|nr:Tex family protein [Moraxella sp.]
MMDTKAQTPITTHQAIYDKLATQLAIGNQQVRAFAELYDDGASVPFIARYRKDKTGGLDDDMLRKLENALVHERELQARRLKVLELLTNQNALTDELAKRIEEATSKIALDEIYQPYRPKRKSLATKATLAGLKPYAEAILAGAMPSNALQSYEPVTQVKDDTGESFEVDYSTTELQLAGVQAIILDVWATQLELLDKVRLGFNQTAMIESRLVGEEKREAGEKFKDYFEHNEPFAKLSAHRLLAMLRGRQQNVLVLSVAGEDAPFVAQMQAALGAEGADERAMFLQTCVKKLWQDKWRPQIEHRLLTERRLSAESDAIEVFAKNLHHLLMAAPAGQKVILGVDPGIRHGVKMAVIDATGDVLATQTVYPFTGGAEAVAHAKEVIAGLITEHQVELVAIGNGTASRESDALVKEVLKEHKLSATALVVSEAGASVYSASELASSELGELDVSLRGAVSIARRLQDPLSELVKVEPKAIGVGQYQHDVNQSELENSLNKVTEDCVNAVGVDVNTASPAILAHIAGLNKNVAQQIVNYRREHGAFASRDALKQVPRLGAKTFEQAAGFLRIKSGSEPLDATGVHPESYELVYNLLNKHDLKLGDVLGNQAMIDKLSVGVEALSVTANVLSELAKPAHDPRGNFVTAKFRDDVNSISDLAIGMELEGVVTNVTAFGCFVDVGVHQDGLVHISEMSDGFVDNPSDVVKPSDVVTVRVISVDEARGRIGFSMKKHPAKKDDHKKPHKDKVVKEQSKEKAGYDKPSKQTKTRAPKDTTPTKVGSFGALLQQAGLK